MFKGYKINEKPGSKSEIVNNTRRSFTIDEMLLTINLMIKLWLLEWVESESLRVELFLTGWLNISDE